MKSKQLTINGVDIIVHSDGSITKPFHKRNKRTFGSKHDGGYKHVGINRKMFQMHRLVAQAFLSNFLDFPTIDHIDGDKAHNNISNLRMATNADNNRAHKEKTKGCSSQYRGVYWHKKGKKWSAYCTIDYKNKHIGLFDDERDAAIARDAYVFSEGFSLEGLNFPQKYTKCA